jgi:hypothetical protein
VNLIAALDDPDLFAPHFASPSWGPWRAFLKAWEGLPLTDEELALYPSGTPAARCRPARLHGRRR